MWFNAKKYALTIDDNCFFLYFLGGQFSTRFTYIFIHWRLKLKTLDVLWFYSTHIKKQWVLSTNWKSKWISEWVQVSICGIDIDPWEAKWIELKLNENCMWISDFRSIVHLTRRVVETLTFCVSIFLLFLEIGAFVGHSI